MVRTTEAQLPAGSHAVYVTLLVPGRDVFTGRPLALTDPSRLPATRSTAVQPGSCGVEQWVSEGGGKLEGDSMIVGQTNMHTR